MRWGWYECVHHQNKYIIQCVYNNYKVYNVIIVKRGTLLLNEWLNFIKPP